MTTPFTLPIPTYQCHKRVQALKISHVLPSVRGYTLVDGEPRAFIELKGDYSEEDIAAFKEYWQKMVEGKSNEWKLETGPVGPSDVNAALASRDAEIERLRLALALAEGVAQRVIAETGFDESKVADWRPVVRDALRPVGPATQAAVGVGQ